MNKRPRGSGGSSEIDVEDGDGNLSESSSEAVLPLVVALLPVALLVLAASNQLAWSFAAGLAPPDKGGGFGLFSTVDRLNNRSIRLTWRGREERVLLRVSPPLARVPLGMRAMALPTRRRLTELAADVRHTEGPGELGVSIWRLRFDSSSMAVRRELVVELALAPASAPAEP